MLRRIVLTGSAALLALTAACGGSSGTQSGDGGGGGTTTINVGIIPITDVAPLYLGVKKGFFAERGLKVKTQTAQGGAAIVPGVVSGQFQFGFSNIVSLLLARDQGLPVKIVANGNNSTGKVGEDFSAVVVPEDSSIKDVADLEGHSVAVNTLQNIGPVSINAAVEEAGGDPSKVKYVELALPDMQSALAEGRVDAAWLVEPFTTMGLQGGNRPVLWNFAEMGPNQIIAGYFTSEQYAQQNPETVKAFQAAMQESLTYAQSHREEAREIITTYTEIEPDLLKEVVLPVWQTDINRDSVEQWAELGRKYGIISKPVDLDALLP